MKVKLLKDVYEGITFSATGHVVSVGSLKSSVRRGQTVDFLKDAVIEMSAASAAKYVDAGLAVYT